MPVYQPRTRLVNFRLSEEEYQVLRETCMRSGARSVSDYARGAVLTGAVGGGCSSRWERLEATVNRLAAIVDRHGVIVNG
jgi:hypothetical protein